MNCVNILGSFHNIEKKKKKEKKRIPHHKPKAASKWNGGGDDSWGHETNIAKSRGTESRTQRPVADSSPSLLVEPDLETAQGLPLNPRTETGSQGHNVRHSVHLESIADTHIQILPHLKNSIHKDSDFERSKNKYAEKKHA